LVKKHWQLIKVNNTLYPTETGQLVGKLYKDREHTVQEICQMMGISKPTLYQYLREMDGKTK